MELLSETCESHISSYVALEKPQLYWFLWGTFCKDSFLKRNMLQQLDYNNNNNIYVNKTEWVTKAADPQYTKNWSRQFRYKLQ